MKPKVPDFFIAFLYFVILQLVLSFEFSIHSFGTHKEIIDQLISYILLISFLLFYLHKNTNLRKEVLNSVTIINRSNVLWKSQFWALDFFLALVSLFALNIISSLFFQNAHDPIILPAQNVAEILALNILLFLVSVLEELQYRYLLLKGCGSIGFSRISSMILSALVFAIGHFYLGPGGIFFSFFAAIVLAILFYRTRTIYSGIIVHYFYNSLLLKIFGYW